MRKPSPLLWFMIAVWAEPNDNPGFLNLRSTDASAVSALVTVYPA